MDGAALHNGSTVSVLYAALKVLLSSSVLGKYSS